MVYDNDKTYNTDGFVYVFHANTEFPLISPQGANLIFRVKAWGLIGGGGGLIIFFALGQRSIRCTPRRRDVTRI